MGVGKARLSFGGQERHAEMFRGKWRTDGYQRASHVTIWMYNIQSRSNGRNTNPKAGMRLQCGWRTGESL